MNWTPDKGSKLILPILKKLIFLLNLISHHKEIKKDTQYPSLRLHAESFNDS